MVAPFDYVVVHSSIQLYKIPIKTNFSLKVDGKLKMMNVGLSVMKCEEGHDALKISQVK